MGFDDQSIEGKRGIGTAGVGIQSLDVVLTRYRAAVDRKLELVPNFVVIAQCYVAEAAKEGFEESLVRMKAYKEIAEVGWVQLTAPGSVEQMKWARDAVEGPSSIMQAYMDPLLSKKRVAQLRYKSSLDGQAHPRCHLCGPRRLHQRFHGASYQRLG